MSQDVELDDVVLSSEAASAYQEFATRVGTALAVAGVSASDIPDEQMRVEVDGSLVVYVTLPREQGEVSMTIPPEHWTFTRPQ